MSEIQLPIGQYEDEDAAASSTDETVEKKKDKKDKKDKKEKKDKKDKKDKRDRKDERDEVTVAIIPSASDALSKVDLPSFLAHSNESKSSAELVEDHLATRVQKNAALASANSQVALLSKIASQTAQEQAIFQSELAAKAKLKAEKSALIAKRKAESDASVKDVRASVGGAGDSSDQSTKRSRSDANVANAKRGKEEVREQVRKGQTFDGRTWKSDAEMVLRQGYDG